MEQYRGQTKGGSGGYIYTGIIIRGNMLNKIEAIEYLESIKYADGLGDIENIEKIIRYIEYMHGKCERMEVRMAENRETIHSMLSKRY